MATVRIDTEDLEALRQLARDLREQGEWVAAVRLEGIIGRDASDDVREDW